MHLIQLFNILSILALSVLAAPSTNDHAESQLDARTFGHRLSYASHPKSYRQSCSVNHEGGYWTTPVQIGGQTKNCKVSTCAADLVIVDDSFSSSVRAQAGLGGFLGGVMSKLTGGLSVVGKGSWGFNFGAGLNVKGSIYKSVVSCGGLIVKGMQFGALDGKAGISAGLGFDGVLGLGFKGASACKSILPWR
jgi:hypothetical protein